ncbi:hypothetical protein JW968_01740 [Candidatus Woesearchaeota archaeon]|nr:hypothetical protein [Candidatus Woesearchaeota archaeon]
MLSAFLKKLMLARQFNIGNGKINILDQENIMFRSSFFYALQTEMDKAKVYSLTKEHVKELTKSYFRKLGASQAKQTFVVEELFGSLGLGNIKIAESSGKIIVVNIPNSTLAAEYKKTHQGYNKDPVCNITSGAIAGLFSFLRDKDLNCNEIECAAQGPKDCKFVINL